MHQQTLASTSLRTQGKLVNETRCLRCETVTCREEPFVDLQLEIGPNTSLTSCLRNFRWVACAKHVEHLGGEPVNWTAVRQLQGQCMTAAAEAAG
jgi:hypothetical protein